jgi:hypothetical protein
MDQTFEEMRQKKVKTLILDLRGNRGGWIDNASLILAYLLRTRHYFPHFYHVPKKKMIALTTVKPRADLAIRDEKMFQSANKFISKISRFSGRKNARPQGQYVLVKPRSWGKRAFNGSLHVLIDGGTFSAASMMAVQLRLKRKVTFYGEPTGGSPNRNCNAPSHYYELPHSKFSALIAWACNIESVKGGQIQFKPDYFFSTISRTVEQTIGSWIT